MSYTLCVIDMQDFFSASKGKRVRKSCIREIKKAMDSNATILFVEYKNYGPTIPLLTKLTKGYRRKFVVLKLHDGGGDEVVNFLTKQHLPKRNIRVCGVNTDACVEATVVGMNENLESSKIEVVADACDSNWKAGHRNGLRRLSQTHQNITLDRAKGQL